MIHYNFSKINPSNSEIKYLPIVNFSDDIATSNKKSCLIVAFIAMLSSPLSNDAITINDSLRYIGEQQIISQEIHLIKTDKAVDILRKNWDLHILISRAEIKIKDYFGLTPLYLETLGEDELLLSIITEKSPDEALDTLNKFDNEWWIENEKLAKGKLCIDVVPK